MLPRNCVWNGSSKWFHVSYCRVIRFMSIPYGILFYINWQNAKLVSDQHKRNRVDTFLLIIRSWLIWMLYVTLLLHDLAAAVSARLQSMQTSEWDSAYGLVWPPTSRLPHPFIIIITVLSLIILGIIRWTCELLIGLETTRGYTWFVGLDYEASDETPTESFEELIRDESRLQSMKLFSFWRSTKSTLVNICKYLRLVLFSVMSCDFSR